MQLIWGISFLLSFQLYSQSRQVKEFTKTLCSSEFHGRGYVENGSNIAADFIGKTFQEIGLAPINGTYFQKFTFDVNTFPANCIVKLDTHLLQAGIDFLVHPASGSTCNSPACPDGRFFPIQLIQGADFLAKKLLFLNSNKVFDYDKDSVLIVSLIGCKDTEIKEIRGALMQLVNSRPIVEITNEKFTWSVSQTAFLYSYIQLKEAAFSTLKGAIFLNIENKFFKNFQARNVFGVIKARKETDKTIIISAHYDHLGRMGRNTYFPGANDNASGNGMLLSLAEKLLLKPLKKYNVIFIAFAAEEAGLIGSEFMAENPILPLKDIRFLLNLDIMGSGEEGVTVVNSTLFDKEYQLLCKLNNRKNALKQIKPRGPAANSDHYYFTQKGVPSFFIYTMGPNKHYHDVFDTFEELSFDAFEPLSKLLTAFIRKL